MEKPMPRRSPAFTLVEMLVVIAIIGILAALLFPALSGVRAKSMETHCANNLRQLGVALYQYATTYGGFYPVATGNKYAGAQPDLIGALAESIPSNAPVWFCRRYLTYQNTSAEESMTTNGIGYFYWAFATNYPSGLDLNASTNEWMRQGYVSSTCATNGAVVTTNFLPIVLMSDRFASPVTYQYHRGRDYAATETEKGTHALVSGGAVRKVSLEKQ